MLFNSDVFLFAFLPLTLAGFYALRVFASVRAAKMWLVVASLAFYAWWSPAYIFLLLFSIIANFGLGYLIARGARPRFWLFVGIALNLVLLGYYKYAGFFLENVDSLFGTGWTIWRIILPIGISFFTFQQIAYLVDVSRKRAMEYAFFDYVLFVSFFPQLIAGPIVHHQEMMPQFERMRERQHILDDFALGVTVFTFGLFKKVIIADTLALYATPVFGAADAGLAIDAAAAWQGALAYTGQIYFDFSGYSDMAIGLGLMFGIRLPINFFSPYKSKSIIEFWRRWHITLSRFLRDYLYIPLGGNRKGATRRYLNLFLVMLIGGLWHGAGWTFVVWGALHGIYLMINHAWHKFSPPRTGAERLGGYAAQGLTLIAVIAAWVFFRAETFGGALSMLTGMAGMSDGALELFTSESLLPIAAAMGIALLLPNTLEIARYVGPSDDHHLKDMLGRKTPLTWRPSVLWALVTAATLGVCIMNLWRTSEFLYFQF